MSKVEAAGTVSLGLGQQRWPKVPEHGGLLLVPVGSTEQHGPHLPLATDTIVVDAVTQAASEQLARTKPSVLVAPAVTYGASGEHEAFPGTISIGHEALGLLLLELARSATRWAGTVVFVSGHGGNVPTLTTVVPQLRTEDRPVAWTSLDLPDADAHAGETETSLLRHLAPWAVRVDLMAPGATDPVVELMPRLRAEGVRAVSGNGVLGDPTASSAARGQELFERLVRNLVAEVLDQQVLANGRLSLSSSASTPGPT